jgi:hypothetical protein
MAGLSIANVIRIESSLLSNDSHTLIGHMSYDVSFHDSLMIRDPISRCRRFVFHYLVKETPIITCILQLLSLNYYICTVDQKTSLDIVARAKAYSSTLLWIGRLIDTTFLPLAACCEHRFEAEHNDLLAQHEPLLSGISSWRLCVY